MRFSQQVVLQWSAAYLDSFLTPHMEISSRGIININLKSLCVYYEFVLVSSCWEKAELTKDKGNWSMQTEALLACKVSTGEWAHAIEEEKLFASSNPDMLLVDKEHLNNEKADQLKMNKKFK